jgi:hypothetical protein
MRLCGGGAGLSCLCGRVPPPATMYTTYHVHQTPHHPVRLHHFCSDAGGIQHDEQVHITPPGCHPEGSSSVTTQSQKGLPCSHQQDAPKGAVQHTPHSRPAGLLSDVLGIGTWACGQGLYIMMCVHQYYCLAATRGSQHRSSQPTTTAVQLLVLSAASLCHHGCSQGLACNPDK